MKSRRAFLASTLALIPAALLPASLAAAFSTPKLHTDFDHVDCKGRFSGDDTSIFVEAWLDGKIVPFCSEANATEGWVKVFDFPVVRGRFDEVKYRRLTGSVQILFKDEQARLQYLEHVRFREARA